MAQAPLGPGEVDAFQDQGEPTRIDTNGRAAVGVAGSPEGTAGELLVEDGPAGSVIEEDLQEVALLVGETEEVPGEGVLLESLSDGAAEPAE